MRAPDRRGSPDRQAVGAVRREALHELLEDWSSERHNELQALLRRLTRGLLDDERCPQPEAVVAM